MCEYCENGMNIPTEKRKESPESNISDQVEVYVGYAGDVFSQKAWMLIDNVQEDKYVSFQIKYCPLCGRQL